MQSSKVYTLRSFEIKQTIRLFKDFFVKKQDIADFKNDVKSGKILTERDLEIEKKSIISKTLENY